MLDQCEFELAYAFRPYLAVNNWGVDDLRREEYWSVKAGTGAYDIDIFYALSYYRDLGDPTCGGCTAHRGDSEWILLRVYPQAGKWWLRQAKLSAHWNSDAESTETVDAGALQYPNGTGYGRPLVWVATHKHANYKSQNACNNGGWLDNDDCSSSSWATNNPAFETEVLPSANLGNSWNPLINCLTTRENGGTNVECYWVPHYTFNGWQFGDEPSAGPYHTALTGHGF